MKSKLYFGICLVFISMILFCQKNVSTQIVQAVSLFQSRIFPSLFPFLVISPFLIQYGFCYYIQKYLGPIFRILFRISENGSYLFLMSMLSGFPSSANYAKELESNHLLTKEEAFHTLLFSHFSNPIFILSMVSTKPYLVLTAHYLGNFLIGMVLRYRKDTPTIKIKRTLPKPEKFFSIFTSAITNAMHNSIFILGVVTFFFLLNGVFPIPIFKFVLELSQGLYYLEQLPLSPQLFVSLAAFLLSFGGFSVHLQTFGILSEWHLPYFPYFLTRLCHATLSFGIAWILF